MSGSKQCGGCGARFEPVPDSKYTNICPSCHVPHMVVGRQEDGSWRCVYCKASGTLEGLRRSDCTEEFSPCPTCREAPYCAPDCRDVLDLLEHEMDEYGRSLGAEIDSSRDAEGKPYIGRVYVAGVGGVSSTPVERSPDSPKPSSPPEDFEQLRSMDSQALREMGMLPWNSPNDPEDEGVFPPDTQLLLIPNEWYGAIPAGFELVGLSGDVFRFEPGETDDEGRLGCLPYGILTNTIQ